MGPRNFAPHSRSPCVLTRIPPRVVTVWTLEGESDTSLCMASVFELRKLRPKRCYKLSKDLEGAHSQAGQCPTFSPVQALQQSPGCRFATMLGIS